MTKERSSIRAQADELRLRVNEQAIYVEILAGKGKPKEMIALMKGRIDILADARDTLEVLARRKEAEAAPPAPAPEPEPPPPEPELDEWGDPILET